MLPGLISFLADYPGMGVVPSRQAGLVLKGRFAFHARQQDGARPIEDNYHLRIDIPPGFPRDLPKVTELDLKIPRTAKHHVNWDGTLCLGSPLRILQKLARRATLNGFAEDCIVPYLYAASHRRIHGGELLFSELAHGRDGELADYVDLFSLKNSAQAKQVLLALGTKKRLANKLPCPCGCEKRLGRCVFNRK